MASEADKLFYQLDSTLHNKISAQYFNQPYEFRSLVEVLNVLGEKVDQINNKGNSDLLKALQDRNQAYSELLKQAQIVNDVIEEVVTFQHGGLNNSVDTMSDVIKEYNKARDDIQVLRESLAETQSVLTSKKVDQIPLKKLWLQKKECEDSLRMLRELEILKNTPHRVQRLIQQKRYLAAVKTLNKAIASMFQEDLVNVAGLNQIRERLMELKETILETCVTELNEIIVGPPSNEDLDNDDSISESEDIGSEKGSQSGRSNALGGASVGYQKKEDFDKKSVGSQGMTSNLNRSIMNKSTGRSHSIGNDNSSSSGALQKEAMKAAENWSFDLNEVDERFEDSILEPSSSGTLFIRLLVRTVGTLNCEQDVERLLLERILDGFRANVIEKCREQYVFILEKKKSLRKSKMPDESTSTHLNHSFQSEEANINGSLFGDYIHILLDTCVSSIQKLLYVMKLLQSSSAQRQNPIKPVNASNVNNKDITPEQHQILLSHQKNEEKNIRDNNRKLVLNLWSDLEDIILQQIRIHLIDPEIDIISDRKDLGVKQRAVSSDSKSDRPIHSMGKANLVQSESVDNGNSTDDEGQRIFDPSSRLAAIIYKFCISYDQSINKLLKEYGVIDSSSIAPGTSSPSESLVSIGKQTIPLKTGQRNPVVKTVPGMTVMESMNLQQSLQKALQKSSGSSRILGFVQLFIEEELLPVIQSTVNQELRELQLNQELFSVQLGHANEEYQSEMKKSSQKYSESKDVDDKSNDPYNSELGLKSSFAICGAVRICFNASSPLFAYWLQLDQHRGMVATILERIIRSFSSAAKDELSNLSYGCTSRDEPLRSALLSSTKDDPLFGNYRLKAYDGRQSVEELIIGAAAIMSSTQQRSNHSKDFDSESSAAFKNRMKKDFKESRSMTSLDSTTNESESNNGPGTSDEKGDSTLKYRGNLLCWDETFWNVGDKKYPIVWDKVLKSPGSISSAAAIGYGCDWLALRMSSMCNSLIRRYDIMYRAANDKGHSKYSHHGLQRPASYSPTVPGNVTNRVTFSGTTSQTSSGIPVDIIKNQARQEILDTKNQLITYLLGGLRELSKTAEESFSFLRGELEVLCLHFIHKLAQLKITSNSTVSEQKSVQVATSATKLSSEGTSRALVVNVTPPVLSSTIAPSSTTSNRIQNDTDQFSSVVGNESEEEEIIVAGLTQNLHMYHDALSLAVPPFALPVLFGSITTIIPYALMRCIIHIIDDLCGGKSKLGLQPSSMPTSVGDVEINFTNKHKARLLRLVVAIQQSLSLFFKSYCSISIDAKRKFVDLITDKFEKVRRYVTLMGLPLIELKVYLKKNFQEFSLEEFRILFQTASDCKTKKAAVDAFNSSWSEIQESKVSTTTHDPTVNTDPDAVKSSIQQYETIPAPGVIAVPFKH